MSKINEIENALKEIDGGAFQKLADAYLHNKGYQNINSLGSVIGSNKVRIGTPDTYSRQDNGKLIFAEHTTDQTAPFSKLKGDLENCLDEEKTGVPVDEIEQIIFCHTSILKTDEERELYKKGKENNIDVKQYGISNIAFDLYNKFPKLAEDFLGIAIDTGQILVPDDFINQVGKNSLSTPLDTDFHFRKDELNRIINGLKNNDLIILSGSAGVGKSRLALEAIREFITSNPGFEPYCILNKGLDIFNDIRTYFSQPGNFLLLVDDANRISQFDYITDLLRNQKEGQCIKVIITVRDYALDKIKDEARTVGDISEIGIMPLKNEEIESFISNQYGITNQLYLERISHIASGNPRLAVMAAKVAIEYNTLKSINDVSALYDEYFASIAKDLQELQNKNVLLVAGIISFFRVLDRSNDQLIELIEKAFGISLEDIWEAVSYLHDIEIVDVYENEVAKINDQVMSTYLFYLCVFKKKLISFEILLDHFFPTQTNRLRDTIYPCLRAFNQEFLISIMKPAIQREWQHLITSDDTNHIHDFVELFWFSLQTDILAYIRDEIKKLEPEIVDISSIDWDKDDLDLPTHPVLQFLEKYRYADEEQNFKIALELACDYVTKIPRSAPQFVYLMTNSFGFSHQCHFIDYKLQSEIVRLLGLKSNQGKSTLFGEIFLHVAKKYLPIEFTSTSSSSGNSITIHRFNLLENDSVFDIRENIWNELFALYNFWGGSEEILSIISSLHYDSSLKQIITKDAENIIPFIKNSLLPDNFNHCLVVQQYLKKLDKLEIPYDKEAKVLFTSEVLKLYKVLSFDYHDSVVGEEFDYNEFEKRKKNIISDYTQGFDFSDYRKLLDQSSEILSHISASHDLFQIKNGMLTLLICLEEKDKELFAQVVQENLIRGLPLHISQPEVIISKLMSSCGREQTIEILSEGTYDSKDRWLFGYYSCLQPEDISDKVINDLCDLYRTADACNILNDFDFLIKYTEKRSDILVTVTNIIVQRSIVDERVGYTLDLLFNPLCQANKQILSLFEGHIDSLTRAYLLHLSVAQNADYEGITFGRILSVHPEFIVEYIDYLFAVDLRTISNLESISQLMRKHLQKVVSGLIGLIMQLFGIQYEKLSASAKRRGHLMRLRAQRCRNSGISNYKFIWHLEDYKLIVGKAIEHIQLIENRVRNLSISFLDELFCVQYEKQPTPEVAARQDEFLTPYIQMHSNDVDLMQLIFCPISQFSEERRINFLKKFISSNHNIEDFKRISLEPGSYSCSGSAVPLYQRRLEFFEKLLPLFDTSKLLDHKVYIEQRICEFGRVIENEKKADFIEDRF